MSAKPGKKFPKKSVVTPSHPVPASEAESPPHPVASPSAHDGESVPAIEAADPRRRRIGQFVLIVVWLYVAALWLLALDQTFDWGIFGPPFPPLP